MNNQEERRKFSRLNILVDVTYAKHEGGQEGKLALTKNISKGGICFVGYEELHESEVVDISIFLPDENKTISALARVAWVKEFIIGDVPKNKRYDVGVEFIDISDDNLSRIDKYVATHIS